MNRRSLASLAAIATMLGGLALAALAGLEPSRRPARAGAGALPTSLRDTGLYADWDARQIAADHLPYTPQYPLWTDGAAKRRWLHLPERTAIDARHADRWSFPVGTRLWKEFAFDGRPVETRYMERTADGWRFATYVWTADGRDAVLAPAAGVDSGVEVAPGVTHAIPSEADCRACHDEATQPVLGVSALQLSSDRDPGALHATPPAPGDVELAALVRRGLVRGLPEALVRTPPRIAARTPTERAALGYLHGNCGGCHDPRGSLGSLGLALGYRLEEPAPRPDAIATTFDRPSRFQPPGQTPGAIARRVAPGDPDASVLVRRLRARTPTEQMPPLGSRVVDEAAVALIERWIAETR